MFTFRPRLLPSTTHFRSLFFALTFIMICIGSAFPGAARAEDNIGIFWNADYTQDAITVNTFPGLVTGYLVLKNSSVPFGLIGWEMCVDVDGPAQFLGWTLEGNAINVESPPCFAVGIGPGVVRADPDALLATFQIMVTGPSPVTFSVRPTAQPSVPDQMSFIPYGTGDLLPMTTLDGQPEVAWVNDLNPHFAVEPVALQFDDNPIGLETVQSVTVTNFGAVPGDLDIALASSGCDIFSLPGISGPVSIPSGESISIPVSCIPQTEDFFSCNLILGGGLNDVPMTGNGWVAHLDWEAPLEVDFGTLFTGASLTLPVVVRNTGDLDFSIDPVISLSCAEFQIVTGGTPSTIQPGSYRTIYVSFRPLAAGAFSCFLELGDVVPAVHLVGSGQEPILDWTINPASLVFDTIGAGATQELTININNTGEGAFLVAPAMPDSCPAFSVTGGAEPFSVEAGTSHNVTVQFSPQAAGDYACSLDLGDVLPDVPLSGSGRDAVISWTAPTFHDFGAVGVGLSETFDVIVSNTGEASFQIDPSLPDTAQNFSLIFGTSTVLPAGQSATFRVQYNPLTPGNHTGTLFLGAIVPAVQLQGEGLARPGEWSVVPDPLDFGWAFIGEFKQETVRITNLGGTILDLDISLTDPGQDFTLPSGAGISQLEPGTIHDVVVQFQPQSTGTLMTTLNIGPEIGSIPVTGLAQEPFNDCGVQPQSIDFGDINIGDTLTRTYSVTNNGNLALTVAPTSNSTAFISSGGARTLEPGQTAYFTVTFQPPGPGTFSGTINLRNGICSDVTLTGSASSNTGPGQNMVGIFFDPNFTTIEAQTFGLNEIVEGYLVLVEPSETSGVGAWELAVNIDGDAQWLSWALEGQNINVGSYNEFIVGIGGSPLPYSPAIKLATFQILVAQPYPSIVYLELSPIRTPSIPGNMVWAPWHDASMLMPLFPFTGQRVVAGINWGSPVGIGNPPPRATVNGGEVVLQWAVPDNPGDGCHVYRRDESGTAVRLTDQPVSAFGPSLNYTDRPSGYADGSVLYYSYSVVIDGAEGPRSLETEIKLTGIPVVTTRLLPNVPNPFNPLTEIRFELSKPQQVRVSVYDVTGRLVKTLADGHLGAGPHARIWQGRDNSGRQVPSGAYYVRLVADGRVDHHKMMLLK